MGEKNYLRLVWLFAFVAFSGVSCWATTESLHLLLPQLPYIGCWIITIGFFIIASIGTKLIVDSLNQNIYMEKRGLKLSLGIMVVTVFWLICSMPTNTHTFFYHNTAPDVTTQDLATTKVYLERLRDNVKTEEAIKEQQDALETKVMAQYTSLCSEIDNLASPGFGPRAKAILQDIATTLRVGQIRELAYRGVAPREQRKLKEQYRIMITQMLEQKKNEIAQTIHNTQESVYKPLAEKQINNIVTMEGVVDNMKAQGVFDENIIRQADVALKPAYATIHNYSEFITFNSEEDSKLYMQDNQVTKVSRLLSVIDVWQDFVCGKYDGKGFVFWIVISILVDIAAFIFFDLAFKKKDF